MGTPYDVRIAAPAFPERNVRSKTEIGIIYVASPSLLTSMVYYSIVKQI